MTTAMHLALGKVSCIEQCEGEYVTPVSDAADFLLNTCSRFCPSRPSGIKMTLKSGCHEGWLTVRISRTPLKFRSILVDDAALFLACHTIHAHYQALF